MPASQYGESPHLPFHSSTGFRLQHCELTLDGAKAALPCETARQGKAERTALPAVDANQSVHFRLGSRSSRP
jgi:hypothetical protein